MDKNRRHHSLFWPILLIGLGVLWLLSNLDLIGPANVAALVSLWPLLLIMAGLDLLLGRISRWIGVAIGLGGLSVAVILMLVGPRLGLGRSYLDLGRSVSGEVRTFRFTEAVDGATAARVKLDLSSDPVLITSRLDKETLIEADITTFGDMEFTAQGGSERSIQLGRRGAVLTFGVPGLDAARLRWDVRLSASVPTALTVEGGSGAVTADLMGMLLRSLDIDGGSGSVRVTLPGSRQNFAATLEGGSGSFELVVPDGTHLDATCKVSSGSWTVRIGADCDGTLRLDGGSGSATITVPQGLALRVDVRDDGSGSVRLPSHLVEISRGRGDIGVWETRDYAAAESRLEIVVRDLSSGSLTIR